MKRDLCHAKFRTGHFVRAFGRLLLSKVLVMTIQSLAKIRNDMSQYLRGKFSTLHFHVDIIAQWLMMAPASFLGGDSISVNAVIGAFEKGHQWQMAMCATGLGQPDIFRCCALITACRRGTLAAFVGYPRWWTGNSPGNLFFFASKLWNELRLSHLKQLILSQGNWISNHSKVYFKD